MMSTLKTLFLLGAIFSVAACVTIPQYKQPVDANTASVRFLHNNPGAYYTILAEYDGDACKHKSNIGWLGDDSNVDTLRIGMLDSEPPSSATLERKVIAGQPLIAGPRQVFPSASVGDVLFALTPSKQEEIRGRFTGACRLPVFTPQAGKEYEVAMIFEPDNCVITPYQLVKEKDGSVARKQVADARPSSISVKLFEFMCDKK